LRFPAPSPCGKTPLSAAGLTKSYGSLEVFSGIDLAIDRGSRVVILGLNGAGKTTLLRVLSGIERPDAGEVVQGHGLQLGYYAQEHETLDASQTVYENVRHKAPPKVSDAELRRILGSFLFGGERIDQLAGTLSGGEKTRLALATLVVSAANVLLLDEPTNNLDPASRGEVLKALHTYAGAIVLVTMILVLCRRFLPSMSFSCPMALRTLGAMTSATWSPSPDGPLIDADGVT